MHAASLVLAAIAAALMWALARGRKTVKATPVPPAQGAAVQLAARGSPTVGGGPTLLADASKGSDTAVALNASSSIASELR
jgi:hypothetical protein